MLEMDARNSYLSISMKPHFDMKSWRKLKDTRYGDYNGIAHACLKNCKNMHKHGPVSGVSGL